LFGSDVDHPGPAQRIEVGETAVGHARGSYSLGSAAYLAHRSVGADELHLVDGMTGPLRAHAGLDGVRQGIVAGTRPQDRTQVVVLEGEEAAAELAVSGEADAVALLAEGAGDARDDADL